MTLREAFFAAFWLWAVLALVVWAVAYRAEHLAALREFLHCLGEDDDDATALSRERARLDTATRAGSSAADVRDLSRADAGDRGSAGESDRAVPPTFTTRAVKGFRKG